MAAGAGSVSVAPLPHDQLQARWPETLGSWWCGDWQPFLAKDEGPSASEVTPDPLPEIMLPSWTGTDAHLVLLLVASAIEALKAHVERLEHRAEKLSASGSGPP